MDEEFIGEIYFQDKIGKQNFVKAESRMLLYPQGRCLVIKPPVDKIEYFKYLYLKSITTDKFNHSEGPSYMKVFLMDPINDPMIYPIDLQMKGDHIDIPLNRNISWFYFIIRVSRSYHVMDDPLFDCKEEDTYGDCEQEELKNIFEAKLNCSPPILANGPDEMCNEIYNQTKEESANVFQLFWNHFYHFEPLDCKTPCTKTTSEVRLNSVADYHNLGMKLTFEPVVHVTRSLFSSTMVDFLTSLGGSVSSLLCTNKNMSLKQLFDQLTSISPSLTEPYDVLVFMSEDSLITETKEPIEMSPNFEGKYLFPKTYIL